MEQSEEHRKMQNFCSMENSDISTFVLYPGSKMLTCSIICLMDQNMKLFHCHVVKSKQFSQKLDTSL